MARTRWYLNEELVAYPYDEGRKAHAEEFPNDAACRWGHQSWLTEAEARKAGDEWADLLDGKITECEFEFGPHDDHSRCDQMLDTMSGTDYDDRDYSDWYGGEAGMENGLRWSDFI